MTRVDLFGMKRYQKDLETHSEYPHLTIKSLFDHTSYPADGTFLCGVLSAYPHGAPSCIWTAQLNVDGSIRRQFAYPRQHQGYVLVNAVSFGCVVGQVPNSANERFFVVLAY